MPASSTPSTTMSPDAPPSRAGRVLVVDDVEAQSYAVAAALRAEGFETVTAATGHEALALALAGDLDAVVLDINLPDLDGYEVCRRIKTESQRFVPVLHLSASSTTDESRVRGMAAGADGYLTHPFDPHVLRAAVRSLVRLRRQDAERRAQDDATSLLQEALDTLEDHVALLSATGTVVSVNRSWVEFAIANGCGDAARGVGASYCDIAEAAYGINAEGAGEFATGLREVLSGAREQFAMEYPCHSETVQRWFRATVRRVRRPGPIAVIVTHSDRTSEHLQRQVDARYRRFVEGTHEGVLAMDRSGVITYANPRMESLLGVPASALQGRTLFDLLPPEEAFAARNRFASRWRGVADQVGMRMRHADGHTVDLLATESPIVDGRDDVIGVLAMLNDVTERRRAELVTAEAHRAADLDRRRLEATLEAIPIGVWLSDASGRLTHINPAASQIWGGQAPYANGIEEYGIYSARWPRSGAAVQPGEWPLARTLASARTISGELIEIDRFDGQHGYVLASAAPILDAYGEVTGGVEVHVDITEHQAAALERERLMASLERERSHLAAIFEHAPAFMAVGSGPNHVFDRVNPAYQALVGDRPLVGLTVAEAMPEVVEQGIIPLLDAVRETGEPFVGRQMPVQLARGKDGALETRYMDLVYQRLDGPDGDHSLVAHGVDVTEQVLATAERLENERRLRDQFAKLPVPTCLWELQGEAFVLVECNEIASATLPEMRGAPVGRSPADLFPGIRHLVDDMRRSLRKDLVIRRTVEVPAPAHGRRIYELTVGPQPPNRLLLHIVDTTERMELEGQLRQAQKMEAVGQLAGGVAHDFNNLLTVISAHSSFLLETLDSSDPQREDAEAIHQAGVRASGLTRQLLAFSRKQILKPQVIDFNATIAETRKMLGRLLGEDIEIAMELATDLRPVVADPNQLDQVVVNLAVNARDAMPTGGRLGITTSRVLVEAQGYDKAHIVPPGEYALLRVTDTGVGMDPAVQARLFEPFFTTKELGQGTGLGLATVYGIVKQSGGYIMVDSTPGRGTRFNVYFPLVASDTGRDELQEAARVVSRGVETVLLVEDDPSVRAVARRMLRQQGYAVIEASSGDDALAVSSAFESVIHLVVSDAVMPGMQGTEVVRRVREQRPEVKVLLMSGYTDDEIVRRGIVSSEVPFIHKPFTLKDFARVVRECLDAPHGQPRS